jgi:hypothetical protein
VKGEIYVGQTVKYKVKVRRDLGRHPKEVVYKSFGPEQIKESNS